MFVTSPRQLGLQDAIQVRGATMLTHAKGGAMRWVRQFPNDRMSGMYSRYYRLGFRCALSTRQIKVTP